MSCIKIKTSKYQTRKGPPYHAKDCKGLVKKGNDKKDYISKPDKKGIYKWVLKKSGLNITHKKITFRLKVTIILTIIINYLIYGFKIERKYCLALSAGCSIKIFLSLFVNINLWFRSNSAAICSTARIRLGSP